jgi:hypothetical protein
VSARFSTRRTSMQAASLWRGSSNAKSSSGLPAAPATPTCSRSSGFDPVSPSSPLKEKRASRSPGVRPRSRRGGRGRGCDRKSARARRRDAAAGVGQGSVSDPRGPLSSSSARTPSGYKQQGEGAYANHELVPAIALIVRRLARLEADTLASVVAERPHRSVSGKCSAAVTLPGSR